MRTHTGGTGRDAAAGGRGARYVIADGPLGGTEILLPYLEVGEPTVVDVTDYAPSPGGHGPHVYVVVTSPGAGVAGRLHFARSMLPGEDDELVA